jgi:hypothetical protein
MINVTEKAVHRTVAYCMCLILGLTSYASLTAYRFTGLSYFVHKLFRLPIRFFHGCHLKEITFQHMKYTTTYKYTHFHARYEE